MSRELRELLMGAVDEIVHPEGQEKCPVCKSTSCSHDYDNGTVNIVHERGCELAAFLWELRHG